jgi:hypothetical protein
MERFGGTICGRTVILVLLTALASVFYEGTLEKAALAQQNYPAPVITGISPIGASPGNSIELSVTGKYFLQGATLVLSPQTGISVKWVKVLSSENLRAGIEIAGSAPAGTRDVTITNPDQRGCTTKAGFHVSAVTAAPASTGILPAPAITGVSPAGADAGANVELVIYGKYFAPEAKISFLPPTGISTVSSKVVSSAEIRVMISIAGDTTSEAKDVTLTNSDGQSGTAKAGFTVRKAIMPSPSAAMTPPGKTEAGKVAEPTYPSIAHVPAESGIERLARTLHGLMTGLVNTVHNRVVILRIRMTGKDTIRNSTFSEIGTSSAGSICPELVNTDYRILYVSLPDRIGKTSIDARPDGSATRPFPTVAEALTQAEALRYQGVEVRVATGTYDGDLIITRPTVIAGQSRTGTEIAGSIINNSVYSLTVESLSIAGPKTVTGDTGREGALIVNNTCALTTLERIDIKHPLKYGIIQTGGKLTARNVRIEGAIALDSIASSGTAVHLSNVDAILNGVLIESPGRCGIRQIGGSLHLFADHIKDTRTMDEVSKAGTGIWTSDGAKTEIISSIISASQSSALIIEGAQTEAHLDNVTIYDTKVNHRLMQPGVLAPSSDPSMPYPPSSNPATASPSAFASIEVQRGARLTMRRSSLNNNEYMALRVRDDSQARITYTYFSHTISIPGSEVGGGTNIQARDNGYVYLENVTSQHADLCGLQLFGGTIDHHSGSVSYNLIGANIATTGFDINRLTDRVIYSHNARNLDTDELPVPDSGGSTGH